MLYVGWQGVWVVESWFDRASKVNEMNSGLEGHTVDCAMHNNRASREVDEG